MNSSSTAGLDTTSPLTEIPGIGSRHAGNLERRGLFTAGDLLTHYPARWVARGEIREIRSLGLEDGLPVPDGSGDLRKPAITVLGVVEYSRDFGKRNKYGKPQGLQVEIRDETGSVVLVFFGGGWRESHFSRGTRVLISGPIGVFRKKLQFQNPEYEILDSEEEAALHTGRMFPVYPLTRGVTQRQMRTWVRHALGRLIPGLEDPLPESLRARYHLIPLADALWGFHFPESEARRVEGRRRLVFDELLLDQLFVRAAKLRRETGKVSAPITAGSIYRRLRASLPFQLTPDQETAVEEILADLSRNRPASRLLQGDVGSGKTVVALLAAAAAADSGLQTAFMVPTEILAEQHFRTLSALGGDLGLAPRMLTGSMSKAGRAEVLKSLREGQDKIVVGTHALFQENVSFHRLGLVVVDEQHRFGVAQRVALMEKGASPHLLVMSATPIPRSLALVHYADLDLTVIRHRPPGRGTVITRVTGEEKRDKVYSFLAERLAEGRQAYIVYPLVEESAKSDLKAATTMASELASRPEFRDHEVALLHGQMRSEDKEAVMKRFVAGEVQVLVATTVIEVGIDVPNASFLIVEHPERYGLSQLHQLRGRIGRGSHKSYCVLIQGDGLDEPARRRLGVFAETDDGFELARLDLEFRGQGDLGGTRQSGRPAFRLADPIREPMMTEQVRAEADRLLEVGAVTGGGGDEWEPLRRRLKLMLEEAGALTDAG